MEHSPEIQLVIESLTKDKRVLLDKVAEIDRVIKRIKYGNLRLGLSQGIAIDEATIEDGKPQQQQGFPLKADLKVQIIKIFDMLGVASKLKDVQDKYKELTGINHNLRESLRNLNKHQILKLIQPKGTMRAIYWIKSEWLEDNGTTLKDIHKFDGFDLLYTDDMIEFK